jgi:hypothetical protein
MAHSPVLVMKALGDDDMRSRSFGQVKIAGEEPAKTWQLAKGTLHDPVIFGHTADWVCACGTTRGRRPGWICHVCGVRIGRARHLRATRFGHIGLEEPVAHPLVPDASIAVVPVLPIRLRAPDKYGGDLNFLYSELVRVRQGPSSLVARRVSELYCNDWLAEPRMSAGRVLRSLLYYLVCFPGTPRAATWHYLSALSVQMNVEPSLHGC